MEGSFNAAPGSVFRVAANSAEAAVLAAVVPYSGTHRVGEQLAVRARGGTRFDEIREVAPTEVLVLTNRP